MVNRKVLMVAYHYPPLKGSSGIQRTLKFSKYLSELGWSVTVLSANPLAYPQVSAEQMREIPTDVKVRRVFAFDTARHLAIAGRYSRFFALPDRWVSWCFGIVFSGLGEIIKNRPDVLWSTYPIATAQLGTFILHKLTGIPWVADFRDSMTEDNYPPDRLVRRICRWIERKTVENAAKVVFTTPGAVRMYAGRYPGQAAEKWTVISNGYDEENFNAVGETIAGLNQCITLVHSGLLYPSERDPVPFFNALSELKKEGVISSGELRIILRATGYDDLFRPLIEERNIQDIVHLEPSVTYQEALREMLAARGLLLFQASNCNHQIPAKLYEYIRAQRPIFAITDHAGDTASVLYELGINTIARLDDKNEIKSLFSDFLKKLKNSAAPVADSHSVIRYSRRLLSKSLSDLLGEVINRSNRA